jgi:predicted DNA-binding transcriptional regulator AlpA
MAGNTLDFVRNRRKAFLTPGEVAALLRISKWTLQSWRNEGQGPCFLKLGWHTVRYPLSSLMDYLESTASRPSPACHDSRPLPQLQAGAAGE